VFRLSGGHFARHEDLRWQVIEHALRQQLFIVTLAGVKTTKRPEMAEVQSGEDATVAKVAIGQYLRKEPVN
jgi:hypothetical protein